MKTVRHPSSTRGHANHGWLDTHHSFSFASYYNPERVHFGVLRVLNDDIVTGGRGFGSHPHDNMEIISIPLSGALEHKDSTGTQQVIHTGDVQIMSAGTGVVHSEYNHSKNEPVNFLQIWVFPREKNIAPRYEQKTFDVAERENRWQTVVSPEESDDALWINQDAYFSLGKVGEGKSLAYQLKDAQHGVYLFVLEGEVRVGETTLGKRDGMGIVEAEGFVVEAAADSEVLLMEVPMR